MGREIEAAALQRGHTISHIVDADNRHLLGTLSPADTDAAIEFTQPTAVADNLRMLLPTGVPVVVGTTGWQAQEAELRALTEQHQTALVHASNFSLGVNIFFRLNEELARLMNPYPQYDPFIEDRHHNQKKDSPSGTALSLAQQLLEQLDRKTALADAGQLAHRAPAAHELSISAVRSGTIVGTHTVGYSSAEDLITITHEAHSRRGFALGSVIAAERVQGRKGFLPFAELLWS